MLKAEIKNFKNIGFKEVSISGKSMIIAGPNQAGKSSLIQAILSPVNSKYVPLEAIKKGEQNGYTEIVIGGVLNGEEVRYRVGCMFSQEHKRGRLTLFDKKGTQVKGGERGILEGIIGDISFDIQDFVKLGVTKTGKTSVEGVREQIEILKGLMPKEDVKKLSELDNEKQEVYDERTEINREIKFTSSQIDKSGFSQEEIEKYSDFISALDVSEEIKKANKTNDFIKEAREFSISFAKNKKEKEDQIKELLAKVEVLKSQIESDNDKKIKVDAFLEKNKQLIDVSLLEDKLNNISAHNLKVQKIKELHDAKKENDLKVKKANELTERLNEIKEEKKQIFKNTKMPVKGLAFDDENVTFRGLPLSNGNIPSSQLIGIGLKIGMALNPNLRLLVIRDGSLLDKKTMNFILKTCEKENYQLLIEVVKDTEEGLTVDFIEQ